MTVGLRQKLFWILAIVCVTLTIAYCILVQTSIMYRMSYQSREDKGADLAAPIAKLEGRYYTLTDDLTIGLAYNLGFVQINKVGYLESAESSISLGNHGAGINRR